MGQRHPRVLGVLTVLTGLAVPTELTALTVLTMLSLLTVRTTLSVLSVLTVSLSGQPLGCSPKSTTTKAQQRFATSDLILSLAFWSRRVCRFSQPSQPSHSHDQLTIVGMKVK
jgi:hypothetical protein